MASEVRLYDLKTPGYPDRGAGKFRSVQVFECEACGALTNLVFHAPAPIYRVIALCPHAHRKWHWELADKVQWLGQPHPARYRRELEKEIETLLSAHRDEIVNDLHGAIDHHQKSPVFFAHVA